MSHIKHFHIPLLDYEQKITEWEEYIRDANKDIKKLEKVLQSLVWHIKALHELDDQTDSVQDKRLESTAAGLSNQIIRVAQIINRLEQLKTDYEKQITKLNEDKERETHHHIPKS